MKKLGNNEVNNESTYHNTLTILLDNNCSVKNRIEAGKQLLKASSNVHLKQAWNIDPKLKDDLGDVGDVNSHDFDALALLQSLIYSSHWDSIIEKIDSKSATNHNIETLNAIKDNSKLILFLKNLVIFLDSSDSEKKANDIFGEHTFKDIVDIQSIIDVLNKKRLNISNETTQQTNNTHHKEMSEVQKQVNEIASYLRYFDNLETNKQIFEIKKFKEHMQTFYDECFSKYVFSKDAFKYKEDSVYFFLNQVFYSLGIGNIQKDLHYKEPTNLKLFFETCRENASSNDISGAKSYFAKSISRFSEGIRSGIIQKKDVTKEE